MVELRFRNMKIISNPLLRLPRVSAAANDPRVINAAERRADRLFARENSHFGKKPGDARHLR